MRDKKKRKMIGFQGCAIKQVNDEKNRTAAETRTGSSGVGLFKVSGVNTVGTGKKGFS